MNPNAHRILLALCLLGITTSLASAAPADVQGQRKLDPRLQKYFEAKERHAHSLVSQLHLGLAPEVWPYFEAGKSGDWTTVLRLYQALRRRSGQYTGTTSDEAVHTPVWQTVNETYGAYEAFAQMDVKFIDAFATDVLDSIPRGSVYFGGTDPGRWLITAFSKSHPDADPCFTLTQNALADSSYLDYLRAMYGKRLYIPTEKESKQAFDEYIADAGARLEKGKLQPGEQVSKTGEGKYQVSGQVAVMAINARLAGIIFDKNPTQEFFIEESFPLDWMYPHLSPNGLIFKINRHPLSEMTERIVKQDLDFWRKQTGRWIGDWLTETTSVKQIWEFADTVYAQGDLTGFKGDEAYATADQRYSPRKIYGKLRAAQAGVYAWRSQHAATPAEKERMQLAADFAFRQALGLGPESPETIYRYVGFLTEQKRKDEARLVAEAGARVNPSLGSLVRKLQEPKTE